ncbi:MAG: hypothetical protein HYV09_34105 [Deltaproteobacteria bacterium]|nr:hypothetical protein [Deltaproteobacteria bacterium]
MRRPDQHRKERHSQPQYEQAVLELPLPPPPRRRETTEHDEERDRGVWIIDLG